nr:MAG TPA: hypothetical protein [Caudoviricetes sp.]
MRRYRLRALLYFFYNRDCVLPAISFSRTDNDFPFEL